MENNFSCAIKKVVSIQYMLIAIMMASFINQTAIAQTVADQNLKTTVPQGTVPASSKDYTKVSGSTGTANMSLPIVNIGGVNVQLTYSSGGVYKKARMENQFAPSGFAGLGWDISIGSISGEVNNSADTTDDRYFYNAGDGNFEIVQNTSGKLLCQSHRPWIIQRIWDSVNKVTAGWKIIKEDGTIFRYGNVSIKDSGSVANSYDSSATRCLLGYKGLVANVDSTLYNSMGLVPYQWDLSDVQDIYGNHTTITYRQVLVPLRAPYDTTKYTTLKYTRESHPYKVVDNKGGEVSGATLFPTVRVSTIPHLT